MHYYAPCTPHYQELQQTGFSCFLSLIASWCKQKVAKHLVLVTPLEFPRLDIFPQGLIEKSALFNTFWQQQTVVLANRQKKEEGVILFSACANLSAELHLKCFDIWLANRIGRILLTCLSSNAIKKSRMLLSCFAWKKRKKPSLVKMFYSSKRSTKHGDFWLEN